MRPHARTIACRADGAPRDFRIVGFDLDPADAADRARIDEALDEARRMAARAENPAGTPRDARRLLKTRYLGALSEMLLREHLAAALAPARVEAVPFAGHDTHVDLRAHAGARVLRIEVRGSFPFRPLERVVCELFDVIGPYETAHKPMEDAKDVYLRTLINQPAERFTLRAPHTLWFVGGATRRDLENRGTWTDLDQQGARYLTIKPICRARDAAEVVAWMTAALRG